MDGDVVVDFWGEVGLVFGKFLDEFFEVWSAEWVFGLNEECVVAEGNFLGDGELLELLC